MNLSQGHTSEWAVLFWSPLLFQKQLLHRFSECQFLFWLLFSFLCISKMMNLHFSTSVGFNEFVEVIFKYKCPDLLYVFPCGLFSDMNPTEHTSWRTARTEVLCSELSVSSGKNSGATCRLLKGLSPNLRDNFLNFQAPWTLIPYINCFNVFQPVGMTVVLIVPYARTSVISTKRMHMENILFYLSALYGKTRDLSLIGFMFFSK